MAIVGVSTSGKTTLAQVLLEFYKNEILPVPQATTRQPRSDDDQRLIKYIPTETKEGDLYYFLGGYGVTEKDMYSFAMKKARVAVYIGSSEEMAFITEAVKRETFPYKRCNVLVTLTNGCSAEIETKALETRMKEFFPGGKLDRIRTIQREFIEESFSNRNYRDRNIDIVLSREKDTILDWVNKIAKFVGLKILEKGGGAMSLMQDIIRQSTTKRKGVMPSTIPAPLPCAECTKDTDERKKQGSSPLPVVLHLSVDTEGR